MSRLLIEKKKIMKKEEKLFLKFEELEPLWLNDLFPEILGHFKFQELLNMRFVSKGFQVLIFNALIYDEIRIYISEDISLVSLGYMRLIKKFNRLRNVALDFIVEEKKEGIGFNENNNIVLAPKKLLMYKEYDELFKKNKGIERIVFPLCFCGEIYEGQEVSINVVKLFESFLRKQSYLKSIVFGCDNIDYETLEMKNKSVFPWNGMRVLWNLDCNCFFRFTSILSSQHLRDIEYRFFDIKFQDIRNEDVNFSNIKSIKNFSISGIIPKEDLITKRISGYDPEYRDFFLRLCTELSKTNVEKIRIEQMKLNADTTSIIINQLIKNSRKLKKIVIVEIVFRLQFSELKSFFKHILRSKIFFQFGMNREHNGQYDDGCDFYPFKIKELVEKHYSEFILVRRHF